MKNNFNLSAFYHLKHGFIKRWQGNKKLKSYFVFFGIVQLTLNLSVDLFEVGLFAGGGDWWGRLGSGKLCPEFRIQQFVLFYVKLKTLVVRSLLFCGATEISSIFAQLNYLSIIFSAKWIISWEMLKYQIIFNVIKRSKKQLRYYSYVIKHVMSRKLTLFSGFNIKSKTFHCLDVLFSHKAKVYFLQVMIILLLSLYLEITQ